MGQIRNFPPMCRDIHRCHHHHPHKVVLSSLNRCLEDHLHLYQRAKQGLVGMDLVQRNKHLALHLFHHRSRLHQYQDSKNLFHPRIRSSHLNHHYRHPNLLSILVDCVLNLQTRCNHLVEYQAFHLHQYPQGFLW